MRRCVRGSDGARRGRARRALRGLRVGAPMRARFRGRAGPASAGVLSDTDVAVEEVRDAW